MIKIRIKKENMKELENIFEEFIAKEKIAEKLKKLQRSNKLENIEKQMIKECFLKKIKNKNLFLLKKSGMEKLIEDIEKEYPSICEEFKRSKNKSKSKFFQNKISEIFNYESLSKKISYSLVEKLNIKVCPYCNRNYIHTYRDISSKPKTKIKKTRGQLDHYFPKSKYPYLGINLYNLIPSCKVCNADFKGDYDTYEKKIFYPYEEEFGEEIKFEIEVESSKEYLEVLQGNSKIFKLNLKVRNEDILLEDKLKNTNNLFKLEEIYQFHKDEVIEILRKKNIYNESRICELEETYGDLFNSKQEIIEMIISNCLDSDNLDKRILSKLTKDIWEEVGEY